jgi:hypothetical protein
LLYRTQKDSVKRKIVSAVTELARKPKQDEEEESPLQYFAGIGSYQTFTEVPEDDKPPKRQIGFIRATDSSLQVGGLDKSERLESPRRRERVLKGTADANNDGGIPVKRGRGKRNGVSKPK